MDFDSPKMAWQIVNLLALIVIFISVFIIPVWIYRKVSSIEGLLRELTRKLEKDNHKNNDSEKVRK